LCVLLEGVGIGMVIHPAHLMQEGPVGETLALQAGPMEKPWLSMTYFNSRPLEQHVVISGPYTKGSVKNGKKEVF
jgi:hypothetical protein